jgi:hypothetical protein
MAKGEEPVTRETVDRLCALADLPLPADRRAKLVAPLAGLVAAANELNRKMAEAGRRGLLPITRFPER